MAGIDQLLSRLRHVHRSGHGWRSDCPNPVHTRARGSLAITETDDGRILLKCFSCHDTSAILTAVGLDLADLYPERIKDPSPEARQRAREAFKREGWRAALGVLVRETTVVLAAAGMLRQGRPFTADDDVRLTLATQRIEAARQVLT